jgi:hypothetical protein
MSISAKRTSLLHSVINYMSKKVYSTGHSIDCLLIFLKISLVNIEYEKVYHFSCLDTTAGQIG